MLRRWLCESTKFRVVCYICFCWIWNRDKYFYLFNWGPCCKFIPFTRLHCKLSIYIEISIEIVLFTQKCISKSYTNVFWVFIKVLEKRSCKCTLYEAFSSFVAQNTSKTDTEKRKVYNEKSLKMEMKTIKTHV